MVHGGSLGSLVCCCASRLTCLTTVVLLILIAASDATAAGASAHIVDYKQYLDSLRPLSFDFEYSTFETGGGVGKKEKLIEYARGSASARGEEFRFRVRQRHVLWYAGKFHPRDSDSEDLITAKRHLHLQADYPTDDTPFRVTDLPSGRPTYIVTAWERNPGHRLENLHSFLHTLFGSLPDDSGRDLVSILQSSEASASTHETVDGHSVILIRSKSDYGTYGIWLDPACGYAPRRIESRKTGNDLFAGRRLALFQQRSNSGDRHPSGRIRERRFEVGNVELSLVPGSDQSIMSRFETRDIRLYQGGESFIQRRTVRLSNVRFECTDGELEPKMTVPTGTQVHIRDAPGIRAEWRDGTVHKIIDEKALERFEGLGSPGNAGARRRMWLIVLNLTVVVVLLFVFIVRRYRAVQQH